MVVGKRITIPSGWTERPAYSVLVAFGLAKEEIAWFFQLLSKYEKKCATVLKQNTALVFLQRKLNFTSVHS